MTLKEELLKLFMLHERLRNSQICRMLKAKSSYNDNDSRGLTVNISRVLTSLRAEGYISVVEDKLNKRTYALTKKGRKKAEIENQKLAIKSNIASIDNIVLLKMLETYLLNYYGSATKLTLTGRR